MGFGLVFFGLAFTLIASGIVAEGFRHYRAHYAITVGSSRKGSGTTARTTPSDGRNASENAATATKFDIMGISIDSRRLATIGWLLIN